LRVVAGLAGISTSQLSEFERGERALNRLSQIVALANALRVDYRSRGVALPSLIQDLHSSMAAGREVAELLALAVRVHSPIVGDWLSVAGAPVDLRWQADMLARQAAEDLGDPTLLGVVAWGAAGTILRSPIPGGMRWAGSCGEWPTGRVCWCSPSGRRPFWPDAPGRDLFHCGQP
jgi:transcriptional regulator with XRE-family HTH domain